VLRTLLHATVARGYVNTMHCRRAAPHTATVTMHSVADCTAGAPTLSLYITPSGQQRLEPDGVTNKQGSTAAEGVQGYLGV